MIKKLVLMLPLALLSVTACKMDGDTLASHKGGKITRIEFYDWLNFDENKIKMRAGGLFDRKMVPVPEHVIKGSKAVQKKHLERMLLQRFLVHEAKENDFDKKESVRTHIEIESEKILVNFVKSLIRKDAVFNTPCTKLAMIYLRVSDSKMVKGPGGTMQRINLDKERLTREYADAVQRAKELIEKLDKGADFSQLAIDHSNYYSRRNKGVIGYQVSAMLPREIASAVLPLKVNAYTKEPVIYTADSPDIGKFKEECRACGSIGFYEGVYIFKAIDRFDCNPDNITSKITEGSVANYIKFVLIKQSVDRFIENLEKASDIVFHPEKAQGTDEKEVIFKVGTVVFTVADLNKRIAYLRPGADKKEAPAGGAVRKDNKTEQGKKEDATLDKLRADIVKDKFSFEVLQRFAKKSGIDKDDAYQRLIRLKADTILSIEYLKYLTLAQMSEKEKEKGGDVTKSKTFMEVGQTLGEKMQKKFPYSIREWNLDGK